MKHLEKVVVGLVAVALIAPAHAQKCIREDKGLSEKKWEPGKRREAARIYPRVVDEVGDECAHDGFFDKIGTDPVLVYDLTPWHKSLGTKFDANQIVISADPESKKVFEKLKKRYSDTGGKIIHNGSDPSDYCVNEIRICVGSSVARWNKDALKGIFLWNKSFPKIGSPEDKYATNGTIAWQPANMPCADADSWWEVSNGYQTLTRDHWKPIGRGISSGSADAVALCASYGVTLQCTPAE